MARSQDSDPLQKFNFYMIDAPIASAIPVAFPAKTAQNASELQLLSFQSITIPTMDIQMKEIEEGNWPFTHSVPTGRVRTGQVTIRHAVTPLSLDFYIWFHQAVYGKFGPRRHFTVVQTRADKFTPRRLILLEGCVPVSWKPAGDMDASSSDVSLEELTMSCHRVEVLPGAPV